METVANIVVVVVDAFGSHYLKKGDKCILPFLSEAKSKGVSLGRAYSLAPFTEAALVGLLGQEGTFENGGYLFANKNVAFSFAERFSSRGFQVVSAYSPYICSDSYLRGAKEFFYTRFYGIHPLLDYRLRQYSEWMNFENKDHILHICTILLSDVFDTWKKQLESLISDHPSVSLLQKYSETSLNLDVYKKLLTELALFERDPLSYAKLLLSNLESASLVRLNNLWARSFDASHLICKSSGVEKLQKEIVAELERRNAFWLFDDTKKDIVWNVLRRYGVSCALKTCRGWKRSLRSDLLLTSSIFSKTKVVVSLRDQLNYVLREIQKEKSGRHLYYVHADDFHLPSVFFNPNDGVDVFEKDLNYARAYLNQAKGLTKGGNIFSELSAHYVDNVIREFSESLNHRNDTLIVITADHGFPDYRDPPRFKSSWDRHIEDFAVPFIVFNPKMQHRVGIEINGIIPMSSFGALIEEVAENSKYGACPLLDRLKEYEQDYVVSEYSGSGCPDLNYNSFEISVFDSSYRFIYSRSASGDESWHLFNLNDDLFELHDLKENEELCSKYLELSRRRVVSAQSRFNNFCYL